MTTSGLDFQLPDVDVLNREQQCPLLQTWVTVWMWITTIIVTWDCSYILTRPWLYNTDIGWYPNAAVVAIISLGRASVSPIASWIDHNTKLAGHAIWWPYYNKYGKMDRFYGPEGWQAYLDGKEGWNFSQSIMNAVEILFQVSARRIDRRLAAISVSTAARLRPPWAVCTPTSGRPSP